MYNQKDDKVGLESYLEERRGVRPLFKGRIIGIGKTVLKINQGSSHQDRSRKWILKKHQGRSPMLGL